MYHFTFFLFILTSILLIFIIMLQEGKSIDKSYDFNSSSIFNIFTNNYDYNKWILKITIFLSIVFFSLNIILSNLSIKNENNTNYFEQDNKHVICKKNKKVHV